MPEQKPKPELLPCPNVCCKSGPRVRHDGMMDQFVVICNYCGWGGEDGAKLTRDEAIEDWNTRPVSELERLAREVVESRCEVESTKIYSSARVVANRKAANAFGALAAFLGPSQKGKQENG